MEFAELKLAGDREGDAESVEASNEILAMKRKRIVRMTLPNLMPICARLPQLVLLSTESSIGMFSKDFKAFEKKNESESLAQSFLEALDVGFVLIHSKTKA